MITTPQSKQRGRPRIHPVKKKKQEKAHTSFTKGVTRQINKDGKGRTDAWFMAACMIKGKAYCRKWSISKYGEDGAKLAATLQKMLWMIEGGVWNPSDGDPLALLSYAESFGGNRDYDDSVIDNISSPWLHYYDDETQSNSIRIA